MQKSPICFKKMLVYCPKIHMIVPDLFYKLVDYLCHKVSLDFHGLQKDVDTLTQNQDLEGQGDCFGDAWEKFLPFIRMLLS